MAASDEVSDGRPADDPVDDPPATPMAEPYSARPSAVPAPGRPSAVPGPVHPSAVPAPARPYQGRRAGVVSRFLANGVDLLVVIAIMALISTGIAAITFLLDPREFHWPQALGWSILVIGVVIVVPYLALSWASTGRTYGKALFGLRVVDFRGRRPHLALAFLRAVACVFVPIGLLWVAVSRHNRSLQDVLLRTSVIYDWVPVDAPDTLRR